MPTALHDQLHGASTETEVLAVVNDFVAQLTPRQINALPEPCRPGKFSSADDITTFARALVQHDCDDSLGTARLVQRIGAFFSRASIRLAEISQQSDA